jgi:acyl-CoA thioesterase FadM
VQQGRVCATGVVVLVHYDCAQKRSAPITPDIAEQLRQHLWPTAEGLSAEAAK